MVLSCLWSQALVLLSCQALYLNGERYKVESHVELRDMDHFILNDSTPFDLYVDYHEIEIPNLVNDIVTGSSNITLRNYCYFVGETKKCSFPGPTFTFYNGTYPKIRLINKCALVFQTPLFFF